MQFGVGVAVMREHSLKYLRLVPISVFLVLISAALAVPESAAVDSGSTAELPGGRSLGENPGGLVDSDSVLSEQLENPAPESADSGEPDLGLDPEVSDLSNDESSGATGGEEPQEESESVRLPEHPHRDVRLAGLEEEVPGFGGAFVDEDEVVNIWLTDPSEQRAERARQILADDAGLRGYVGGSEPGRPIRPLKADHAFRDLHEWRVELQNYSDGDLGISLSGIDDKKNKILIGTPDIERYGAKIEARFDELGAPSDAYRIKEFDYNFGLRDERRPLVGGLLVSTERHAEGLGCTLGWNAHYEGISGVFIASHCTAEPGSADGEWWWQPDYCPLPCYPGLDAIGHVEMDPPFTSSWSCPSERECRYSDAALVEATMSVEQDWGHIARVLSGTFWAGSRYRITETYSGFAGWGTTLSKVGQRTGFSAGEVSYSCIDVSSDDQIPGKTFLCQDAFQAQADGGDSGSPVFEITHSPDLRDVRLAGILSGYFEDTDGDNHIFYSRFGALPTDGFDEGRIFTCHPDFTGHSGGTDCWNG